jgi:hypothetical protein
MQGVTDGIKSSTLVAHVRGDVYQGMVLDICHIYVVSCQGRQPLRGVNVTPSPLVACCSCEVGHVTQVTHVELLLVGWVNVTPQPISSL